MQLYICIICNYIFVLYATIYLYYMQLYICIICNYIFVLYAIIYLYYVQLYICIMCNYIFVLCAIIYLYYMQLYICIICNYIFTYIFCNSGSFFRVSCLVRFLWDHLASKKVVHPKYKRRRKGTK